MSAAPPASSNFTKEMWMARERVVDRLATGEAKAKLSQLVGKMRWRRRLDEAIARQAGTSAAFGLALVALAKPATRIDRYFLGAMRKLLFTR